MIIIIIEFRFVKFICMRMKIEMFFAETCIYSLVLMEYINSQLKDILILYKLRDRTIITSIS